MSDWWQVERTVIQPEWQSGTTTYIEGRPHIFGCVRDSRCLYDGRLCCDCTCHNDENVPPR